MRAIPNYVYATQNPITIQMLGAPGAYELRYVSMDKTIVHRRPITVTEAPLTLTAQDSVLAGSLFPVNWQGPDADYDNIRIGRLCCTNPMRDSSCESSVIAGLHEQTHISRLQDQELARIQ